MDDKEIVALYWRRDEEALSLTRAKYEPYLYMIAYNILRLPEDAEESVSDTYIGAWNSMPPQKPSVLRTYLGRLTRNISLKRYRYLHAQKRYAGETTLVLSELEEVISARETVDEAVERKELTRVIGAYLADLDSEKRMIFLMRYWYLCPVAEIAKRLGFTQSKVKMTLKRTRDDLRDLLGKEGLL
ncbi:MAG: sigma-70 family RNA polymerase sigma factor [Ruminococcus sp.]|nr:sigma-70 family RNA polymerase sigma factor [Ruminococcus sp.]